MKLAKRALALILVLCFIGLALVGCGGKKNDENENNDSSNDASGNVEATRKETNEYGEPSFSSVVPTEELDFEGEELTVLVRDSKISYREWGKETSEDELDEAVLMRNAAVEESLNLTMTQERVPTADFGVFSTNYNNMIMQDVTNDFHYYDIAANYAYCGAYPNVRDYAANLNDEQEFPYFDFSLPCWNQAIINNTTMNGRLHYVSGDVNLTLFDAAIVIWYNKTLYDEKRESNDPENMQEFALDGLWTYNELYMWATRLYEDSNGTSGKQHDDTYGFATSKYACAPHDALPYAWDLEFLTYNPDGTHDFNIIGNDKAEDAFIKFRNLIEANGNCTSPSVENFTAGHYVFWPSLIYSSEDANMMIREMDDTYGLLPMPKYNVEQEQYGTTTQDFYTLMTVIDHSTSTVTTKGAAVSAYLQLMTEESYTSVRGYYFNRIIKPKYFGTDDSEGTVTNSIALFDIIVSNIEFEYWTIYSAQLNDIAWLWRDGFRDDAASLESVYLAKEASYVEAIHGTDVWLGLRSE
jgi:hypothetical protein